MLMSEITPQNQIHKIYNQNGGLHKSSFAKRVTSYALKGLIASAPHRRNIFTEIFRNDILSIYDMPFKSRQNFFKESLFTFKVTINH